jgi:hypothetical protein
MNAIYAIFLSLKKSNRAKWRPGFFVKFYLPVAAFQVYKLKVFFTISDASKEEILMVINLFVVSWWDRSILF